MRLISITSATSPTGQVDFQVWQGTDGWWSCRLGEYRGAPNKTADLGPFKYESQALDAQHDAWAAYLDYLDKIS